MNTGGYCCGQAITVQVVGSFDGVISYNDISVCPQLDGASAVHQDVATQ